jgi:hypothetical protein
MKSELLLLLLSVNIISDRVIVNLADTQGVESLRPKLTHSAAMTRHPKYQQVRMCSPGTLR